MRLDPTHFLYAVGNRAPVWPFEVNRESPHADGLIFAAPLTGVSRTWELVHGRMGGESGPVAATEATFGVAPADKEIAGAAAPDFGGGSTDDAIIYDNPPPAWELTHTNRFTISAWIYPRSNGQSNQGRIVDNDGARTGGGTGWSFRFNNSSSLQRRLNFSKNATTGTWSASMSADTGYVLNQWNHVAVIVDLDAGTVRFFRNGAFLQQRSIQAGAIVSSGDPLVIGRDAQRAQREFDGWILHPSIWDRAKPDRFVKSLYDPQTRWSQYRESRVPRVWPKAAAGGAVTRTAIGSLEAALKRQGSLLAPADAALRAEAVLSALAGAVLEESVTGGASLDLAVQVVAQAQADLDTALTRVLGLDAGLDANLTVQGAAQRAAALDGAVRSLNLLSGALEAALRAPNQDTAVLDAWMALSFEGAAGLDAVAQRGGQLSSATLQGILRATPGRAATMDAIIGLVVTAAGSRTFKVGARGGHRVAGGQRRSVIPSGNRRH